MNWCPIPPEGDGGERISVAMLEDVLRDDWHPVADLDLPVPTRTRLFGATLAIHPDRSVTRDGARLPTRRRHGFLWTSLGAPSGEVIEIPEAAEPDRHVVHGGSFGVRVSGLRAVENFLDMGHFPFVHDGWLGAEPHTEVPPYSVTINTDGVVATDCRFYQPVASPTADQGIMVDYVYRVIRPYTVALYKTNPGYAERRDYIALFIQPTEPDRCIVHTFLAYLKKDIDAATVRWFMQLIFAQDKPILENQFPALLPLDPRAETPIRADAASVAYRRWLRDLGVRYGAIPA
jgi:phenylpropionate dioxygenase-like ring-hydroxylating dioxygenase large terminal subunit